MQLYSNNMTIHGVGASPDISQYGDSVFDVGGYPTVGQNFVYNYRYGKNWGPNWIPSHIGIMAHGEGDYDYRAPLVGRGRRRRAVGGPMTYDPHISRSLAGFAPGPLGSSAGVLYGTGSMFGVR